MKPVAAGAQGTDSPRNEDALALAAASNVTVPYQSLNPYCLRPPVSPHIAAKEAGIEIDPAVICAEFSKLEAVSDRVIVEGAGGWLAPIGDSQTMEDVAIALGLPVILVVGLRLGCLNHALLTVRSIRASGLPLAHWIGNSIDPKFERAAQNIATLAAALGPPLAVIAHGGTTPAILADL
jgi:dethiobiotin synthetase